MTDSKWDWHVEYPLVPEGPPPGAYVIWHNVWPVIHVVDSGPEAEEIVQFILDAPETAAQLEAVTKQRDDALVNLRDIDELVDLMMGDKAPYNFGDIAQIRHLVRVAIARISSSEGVEK